jgi:hypothetical protein
VDPSEAKIEELRVEIKMLNLRLAARDTEIAKLHGAVDTLRQLRELDAAEIQRLRITIRGGV